MALLNEEIRQEVAKILADLTTPVRLIFFNQPERCDYCEEISQLAGEIASISERISLEIYDITKDLEKVEEFKIDKAPAIAIVGEKDYGIRFFGFPAGYEFSSLLHGIQAASRGVSGLDPQTQEFLRALTEPVHIQVFVTTSCPYCPRSAAVAYEMALASDMVRADVVEASEFPELADQYNVMGVPLNVINETQRVEGAAPPDMILNAVKEALLANA